MGLCSIGYIIIYYCNRCFRKERFKPMYTEDDIRKLRWQSRRGMLELDVLFVPFVEEAFAGLDQDDQDRFVKLLACEDQDLFVWLMEREVPADPDLQRIVRIILERVQPK